MRDKGPDRKSERRFSLRNIISTVLLILALGRFILSYLCELYGRATK